MFFFSNGKMFKKIEQINSNEIIYNIYNVNIIIHINFIFRFHGKFMGKFHSQLRLSLSILDALIWLFNCLVKQIEILKSLRFKRLINTILSNYHVYLTDQNILSFYFWFSEKKTNQMKLLER